MYIKIYNYTYLNMHKYMYICKKYYKYMYSAREITK